METLHRKGIRGFTVIELMVALTIVGILLALAYPSYVDYTRKAKRGEAQQLLMNWAINQEIYRSNNSEYAPDTSLVLPKPTHQDGLYVFAAREKMVTEITCAGGTGIPLRAAYWLEATAQADQVNDTARDGGSCATLCLSSSGTKQPVACWD
jgi:type IV pilus assembly protein PilE